MQIKPLSVFIGLCIGALAACSSPSSPPITSFSGAGMTGSSAGTGNNTAGSAGTSSASAGTGGQSTGSGGTGGNTGHGGLQRSGFDGRGRRTSGQARMSAGCGKPRW